jgi:hypothetical protein
MFMNKYAHVFVTLFPFPYRNTIMATIMAFVLRALQIPVTWSLFDVDPTKESHKFVTYVNAIFSLSCRKINTMSNIFNFTAVTI